MTTSFVGRWITRVSFDQCGKRDGQFLLRTVEGGEIAVTWEQGYVTSAVVTPPSSQASQSPDVPAVQS